MRSPYLKNTPYVVSRYYRAPELIFASNKYNEAIDIWAVGCILFELLTRTPLFPGDTEGLQILEQACIIGTPSDEELRKLSEIVEERVLSIVKKATILPKMILNFIIQQSKIWRGGGQTRC
jgi:serine/threonine protein kinase